MVVVKNEILHAVIQKPVSLILNGERTHDTTLTDSCHWAELKMIADTRQYKTKIMQFHCYLNETVIMLVVV